MYTLPFKSEDKIIELGGGRKPLYHPNVDIRNLSNVDLVVDFNSSLPIPNDYYDGLFCRYALEHISWRKVRFFISECHRILRSEGIAIFVTANLLEQARVLVSSPADKWNDNLIGMIFGGQDYEENAHQCGFSPEYLKKNLREIGFDNIKISSIYSDFGPTDMIIECIKGGRNEH